MLCKTSSAVLVELPLATPLESGDLDYRAGSPMGSNPFYLASLRAELEFYRSTEALQYVSPATKCNGLRGLSNMLSTCAHRWQSEGGKEGRCYLVNSGSRGQSRVHGGNCCSK